MDANTEAVDVYGRLDVTIPEAGYEADKVSTVSLLLRNPFDNPVEVLEIQGPRSLHLSEIAAASLVREAEGPFFERQQPGKKIGWFRSLFQGFKGVLFSEVSFGGITVEFLRSQRSFNIKAEPALTLNLNPAYTADKAFKIFI